MAKYYSMLERDMGGPWRIQFGAYDRADVEAEMESRIDDAAWPAHPRNVKIIRTSDKQADIQAVVDGLNQLKGN